MSHLFDGIEGWSSISLKHMLYAYRKAKADCYFDRIISVGELFAAYEEDLTSNLQRVLRALHSGDLASILAADASQVRLVAKKLTVEEVGQPRCETGIADRLLIDEGHTFFSDARRAFDRLVASSVVTPEFRAIGNFTVDIHVISALWILTVGDKLDQCLGDSAYGARLRRVRPESALDKQERGSLHVEALGSFQPYYSPYRKWREGGMAAIRQELKSDRNVIAMSLDLANYYHQIDPSFLLSHDFFSALGLELSPWEAELNREFVTFLLGWSRQASEYLTALGASIVGGHGGIPIGIAATRIISNVLLAELDREIERGLAPIYYGRYVDDIFLVLRDPGHVLSAGDALRYIADRVRHFPKDSLRGPIQLRLTGDYQGSTVLALQPSKQKAFFLSGQGGLDLLDSIEAQIRSVSSERRLMPSPDRLGSMASAKVLSAAGSAEEADTLRRADGLSVRRLSWALQLRAVEILARDLRNDEWKSERSEFYQFAISHILRPDKILDHFDYLPRLLSLAVAMTDWKDAKRLFDTAIAAVRELEEKSDPRVRVNGLACPSASAVWASLITSVNDLAREALLASVRWDTNSCAPHPIPAVGLQLCRELALFNETELQERALALREIDWAKTPYKQHLRLAARRHRPASPDEWTLALEYSHLDDLIEFLGSCSSSPGSVGAARTRTMLAEPDGESPSLLPYLCPTRPYTTQEISLYLPELCVVGDERTCASNWARYTRAVRGVWVWGGGAGLPSHRRTRRDSSSKPVAYLGGESDGKPVRLGISNLLTSDACWSKGASGHPDLGRERYKRVESIVNQAILAVPRPQYLLLPELALPERWIDTVSTALANAGIGLVAGLDYQTREPGRVHSSAVMVLSDTRLGFPATVEVRQVKCLPAPGEDMRLQKDFGVRWTSLDVPKPVYIHNGFCFGVLVCSELQNVDYRSAFQGDVDCVMVLSWNQDIETFSALVEAASLDVHASIALVNNREFGDSRVRIPAKKSHLRDVCRLRGGKNDHVVVVELDTHQLRAFQSRANRWPDDKDPFKPVPEAFGLASYRRVTPE